MCLSLISSTDFLAGASEITIEGIFPTISLADFGPGKAALGLDIIISSGPHFNRSSIVFVHISGGCIFAPDVTSYTLILVDSARSSIKKASNNDDPIVPFFKIPILRTFSLIFYNIFSNFNLNLKI